MGSLRSVGWDPLGVMEGIPKGSQERSLGDESGLKRGERKAEYTARLFDRDLARMPRGYASVLCDIKLLIRLREAHDSDVDGAICNNLLDSGQSNASSLIFRITVNAGTDAGEGNGFQPLVQGYGQRCTVAGSQ